MPFDYRKTISPRGGKILKNYFDYTDEKLTDRAFLQSVTISIIGILLCIVSLCSATYAWFVGNISSNSNTLTSGSFDLDVFIKEGENAAFTESDAAIIKTTDGTVSYKFAEIGTYTVKLEMTDYSNVKGYCKISVGGEEFITSSVSKDSALGVNPLTFTIKITKANTTLVFTPCWGYPSASTINNGGELTLTAASPDDSQNG